MILGLTQEEKNKKLQKILMDILGAIEAGDADAWDFDVDLRFEHDECGEVEVTFTVMDKGSLIDVLTRTLWGKDYE